MKHSKQFIAIQYSMAKKNNEARMKAIEDAGLGIAFSEYRKDHRGYSINCLSAHFCKIHKIDWRNHL